MSARAHFRRGLRGLCSNLFSHLFLLTCLLLAGGVLPVWADKPTEKLTPEKRAQLLKEGIALNQRAYQRYREGHFAAAVRDMRRALSLFERLYPADRFPNGHPNLAAVLDNLGSFLEKAGEYRQARAFGEKALAMWQKLYPADRFPNGHPDLAVCLLNLGGLYKNRGEYGKALPYYEQALAMYRKLYPPSRFPNGHPTLAAGLGHLGDLFKKMGEPRKALPNFEQALAMNQKLYPADRFPAGHPDLADSLNNLGLFLCERGGYGEALPYWEKALAIRQKLYPPARYPAGHLDLAQSLNNLGSLLQLRGEYRQALPYLEQTLAMYRKLYPADRYPDGHADLVLSLNHLGYLLQTLGEPGKALPCCEQALAMGQKLYPADRYPEGHPELAQSLNNLGLLLWGMREPGKALPYLEQALAMYQKLYPPDRYPAGHSQLAQCLNNVGLVVHARGEFARALPYFQKALAVCQKLYPADRYPAGHPYLARALGNLGIAYKALGEYDQARLTLEKSLAMQRRLYSPDRYPAGHPALAHSLTNLTSIHLTLREFAKALPYCEQALAMQRGQLAAFAEQAAEAEALALSAQLPMNRDALLSLTGQLAGTEGRAYREVWSTKAALTQVLHRRHLAALAAQASPAVRQRWQELADTRRLLAARLSSPDSAGRQREIRDLTDRKEKLEGELAAALPPLARVRPAAGSEPEDLARHLPQRTAFVDLLRYWRLEQDAQVRGKKGERRTLHYVAFLMTPEQPVRRIELGRAEPLEKALRQWRADIAQRKDAGAGAKVSQLLWQPIARHLPRGTQRLFLSPDEDLAGLPWAALPIGMEEVLLERYTLAVVPHGPFLLDQLLHPAESPRDPGRLLALGGVQYDRRYPALPGTRLELDRVAGLAGPRSLVRLEGSGASAVRLLEELPRVRYAHLATHGFFNQAAFLQERDRQTKMMKTWQFDSNRPTERVGLGARNPLAFTGLVLAGEGEKAIVTGESLVELPLEGLHLAVMSACETGLGARSVGGEVHGLQRAFHLAGCRNVVVSLWQVPDVPTLVLMEEFYKRLWDEKKPLPPAEALRQAQLEVLRHPEKVTARAQKLKAELVKRGASADQLRGIQKVLAPLPEGGKVEELKRSPPLWWAGFVLSGDGK